MLLDRNSWKNFWSFRIALMLILCREVLGVVVTDVHLITKHNKKDDYVLHGQEASLTCLFILDQEEEILSVTWFREGEEVYLWQKNRPPVAKGALQGRVDLTNKSPSQIKIENAHMDMHGKYVCRVKTDNKVAENEFDLIVIVDACKESSWETYTDMIQCTETVSLHCVGMFPKPSPHCGVINKLTQTYVTSVPLDQTRQLRNGTYEIRMNRRFEIKDFINYKDITFTCEILVKETTWKKGIQHMLFGDRGCVEEPPDIEDGFFNMTEEGKTCWGYPRDGTLAHYSCLAGDDVRAVPDTLVCRNGSWVPTTNRNGSWVLEDERNAPRCRANCLENSFTMILIYSFIALRISWAALISTKI